MSLDAKSTIHYVHQLICLPFSAVQVVDSDFFTVFLYGNGWGKKSEKLTLFSHPLTLSFQDWDWLST